MYLLLECLCGCFGNLLAEFFRYFGITSTKIQKKLFSVIGSRCNQTFSFLSRILIKKCVRCSWVLVLTELLVSEIQCMSMHFFIFEKYNVLQRTQSVFKRRSKIFSTLHSLFQSQVWLNIATFHPINLCYFGCRLQIVKRCKTFENLSRVTCRIFL